ncbi:MAG: putative endonuclease [Parcubacteria group bacterium Gr01-1014_18]|nr:MAG: putative endonuclease [Parcubacteria group bacterium Greene0416_36]TSC81198.1 MAG: putative endonuclease [Parcubacteria group bacterium Gr01-1014_18]TSC99195.1 MAG: putative endonuclease [Parcubacteria group bacterium Greene1014_20]TSD07447.1 MAG: putative endonuclease [Parcubacteria group bacterium Greene0714_2]
MSYWVYIVCCCDGSLYTGSTHDLDRRIEEHNHSPKAARYTKNRRPVELVYSENCATWGTALSREAEIKRLSRDQKKRLFVK